MTTTRMVTTINLIPEERSRIRSMVPSTHELRIIDLMRDYRAIRKSSFGNSIPPVEAVGFSIVPREIMNKICPGGKAFGFSYSDPDFKTCHIGIADDSEPVQQGLTLRHEMGHIKVNREHRKNMGHGKHFDMEMRRLARIGCLDGWV